GDARPGRDRRADQGDPRRAPRRHRGPGCKPARLLHPRRPPRAGAGALPRLRPGGRAVPALRHADREDPHGRPGYVVLPELPASGGEPLGETAVTVEPPELGVAADRALVDEDLRHRPATGQVEELLPERGVVVEPDLLVLDAARLEQRLRAHAVP